MNCDPRSRVNLASLHELIEIASNLVRATRPQTAQGWSAENTNDKRLARHAKTLSELNGNDSLAVQGALYSAWSEFDLLIRPSQTDVATSQQEQAKSLIRIAYNRAKRAERRGDRFSAEAARGEGMCIDSNERPIEQISAKIGVVSAHLRELIMGFYGDLSENEQLIVGAISEGYTQDEVARRLGCHRSTISRIIDRISDRVRHLSQE